MSNASQVKTLKQFIEVLDLQAVHFYEISAQVNEEPRSPDTDEAQPATLDSEYGVRVRVEDREFGARIRAEINIAEGRVVVDVAAEYTSEADYKVDSELAFQFVNDVTLMHLFPYIRESVQSISAKVLDRPVLLPVLQRGQMAFAPAPDIAAPE